MFSGFYFKDRFKRFTVAVFLSLLIPASVFPQGGNPAKDSVPPDSDLLLRIAEESFKDRKFYQSIESLRSFLVLYPGNSKRTKVLLLLRDCFLKLDRPEKALEVSLNLYKMEPTGEFGLESYLEAGRLLAKMGEIDQAKEVFSSICRQSYSRVMAEKAALEFSGLDVLSDVEPSSEADSCREK
ncbi:hypothetical protein LEP1GSC058_2997 [Leptospira fainei serovar Hurstbridge str. BUT 6]|uniref:Uncharacterized protein n=1 Tax=Leptospira fainei serovar Hurstbridge str. BUT 6 TaxID=1193011 RepID=S3USR8_9LEPT|nr:hypothetical protein LEP1GSC058_2997 [Leptospira fainei serovar Hurstbridge str. BUT 6]